METSFHRSIFRPWLRSAAKPTGGILTNSVISWFKKCNSARAKFVNSVQKLSHFTYAHKCISALKFNRSWMIRVKIGTGFLYAILLGNELRENWCYETHTSLNSVNKNVPYFILLSLYLDKIRYRIFPVTEIFFKIGEVSHISFMGVNKFPSLLSTLFPTTDEIGCKVST